MARQKLEHFAEMKGWDHVLEPQWNQPSELPGTWGERVILELGCGKGVYTLGLARLFPESTVVGVDIKGARMWHGAKLARMEHLGNVRFLRIRIEDLAQYFKEGEVDEIWVTFPDPHPREGRARRRLTSPRFLELYRKLLKPGGKLHLKTDDPPLFDYSLQTVMEEGWQLEESIRDVHGEDCDAILKNIRTPYEERFLKEGRKIHYLRAEK